ncbi:MAG TPA: hypothetical protein VK171_16340 [Fimbriimonas sp.]|nr:hypothetical protein [Fimbriimonas sp.]
MTLLSSLSHVIQLFDSFGIKYVVGGSLASSAWGQQRATQDADLAILINSNQLELLIESLSWPYVIDQESLRSIVDRPDPFDSGQILNGETSDKIDLFLLRPDEYTFAQFERARFFELGSGVPLRICSAEDIIITKLRWFELGNRVSDKQWNDIVQVLEMQQGQLDESYMTHWAEHFGVIELLQKAQTQVVKITD